MNHTMTDEERRAAAREYHRAYRIANKEQLAEKSRAWREANREERLATKAAYREKNRADLAAKQRVYNAENRDERNAYGRAYQQTHKNERRAYAAKNKERINEKGREWYQANSDKLAAASREWYHANKDKVAVYRTSNRTKILAQKKSHHVANRDSERAYRRKPEVRAHFKETLQQFRASNPEKQREYQRRSNLKERAEQEALAGRPRPTECEVCGRTNKSGRPMGYDHCHQKGHFRGWLCHGCNAALGLVNDDTRILRKLIAYLDRTKENTAPQLTLSGI